jgi:hypothetical protein
MNGSTSEVPGGSIQAIPNQEKPGLEIIRDERLDCTPLSVQPPPETPELSEARQLVTELVELEKLADNALIAILQQAVKVSPIKPGGLLGRLRDIRSRGYHYRNVYSLALEVVKTGFIPETPETIGAVRSQELSNQTYPSDWGLKR